MYRTIIFVLSAIFIKACASTTPPDTSEQEAAVWLPQQVFIREGEKALVTLQPKGSASNEFTFGGRWVAVPTGETIEVVTMEQIDGNPFDFGVAGYWGNRFLGTPFGPFDPGACYVAYFEPVKIEPQVNERGGKFDYGVRPSFREVGCEKEAPQQIETELVGSRPD